MSLYDCYMAGVDAQRQTAARGPVPAATAAYLASMQRPSKKRRRDASSSPSAAFRRFQYFGGDSLHASVRLIQCVFRRFSAQHGIAATLARMRAHKGDPCTQTAAEWSVGIEVKKDALRRVMRMLSRVCCRRIRVSTGMDAAETALLMGPHICNPMCPVAFADAFFIAHDPPPPPAPPTDAAWRETVRIELHSAVASMAAATDRFLQLPPDQQTAFRAVGARLAQSYKTLLAELDAPQGQPSLRAALDYELAVASFRMVYRQFTHAAPCGHDLFADDEPEELTGLQAGINALLREIAHSLDRMVKRTRVLMAIRRGPRTTQQTMRAPQEQQMAKLVHHVHAKLHELARVMDTLPLPAPLVQRLREALCGALSVTQREKRTREAALLVVETLISHAKAQPVATSLPFFDAAACILAAADTRPDISLDALIHAPALHIDDIAVDAWDVVATALRRNNTGAAAFLLADVNKVALFCFIRVIRARSCDSPGAHAGGHLLRVPVRRRLWPQRGGRAPRARAP